jgi:hypothetical protein
VTGVPNVARRLDNWPLAVVRSPAFTQLSIRQKSCIARNFPRPPGFIFGYSFIRAPVGWLNFRESEATLLHPNGFISAS